MRLALLGMLSLSASAQAAEPTPWLAACSDLLKGGAQGRWSHAQVTTDSPAVGDQVQVRLDEDVHVFSARVYKREERAERGPSTWTPVPRKDLEPFHWRGTFLWQGTATRTAMVGGGVWSTTGVIEQKDVDDFLATFEPLVERCLQVANDTKLPLRATKKEKQ